MPSTVAASLLPQQAPSMFTNSHCSRDTHVMYEDLRNALRFATGRPGEAPRGDAGAQAAKGGIVRL